MQNKSQLNQEKQQPPFPTPVYAHAFELANEFEFMHKQLENGKITEEEWLYFFKEQKELDVTQWL